MDKTRAAAWPLGANNVAKPNRLPDGAVRDLLNLDPGADGSLSLRAGGEKVFSCEAGRAAFGVGQFVVIIDGQDVVSYDTRTDSGAVIGELASAAPVAGAVLDGWLFLSSATDSLRTDGAQLLPWGVRPPGFEVELIDGALQPGTYKVAATATGALGEESGAVPKVLNVPAGKAIRVTSSDSRAIRVYATAPNGSTLYSQGVAVGGLAITKVDDNSRRLTTAHKTPMPYCEELAAAGAVIVGRQGTRVFATEPMMPHLMDPLDGFFQYPYPPNLLAGVDGGVFVAADKTYFVSGIGTAELRQRPVLEFGAAGGSATRLPDGRAAWLTRYGMAIGNSAGEVVLPNRNSYAPSVANQGAAGLVDYNGNQMFVATMRGVTDGNQLCTGDFAELETGNE